jgi:hypothetical protein
MKLMFVCVDTSTSHNDEQPNGDDNTNNASDADVSSFVPPTTAAARGPARESNTRSSASAVYGLSNRPTWSLAQPDTQYVPSLVSDLTTPSTSLPTPPFSSDADPISQQQSWEVIERPQSSQQTQLSRPPQPFEWPRSGGDGDISGDSLRFVSEHPLQSQPLPRVQRREPFQDRKRQEDASMTRGLKACVRCRMQRIRVRKHYFPGTSHLADCLTVCHR